jgi:hypothetical protein
MKRLAIVLLPALFLAACATSGRIGEMPKVNNPTTGSKVVVVRISSLVGAANAYTVAVGGKDLFHIGSGEHTEFLVEAGEHSIGVKCFGGWNMEGGLKEVHGSCHDYQLFQDQPEHLVCRNCFRVGGGGQWPAADERIH